MFWHHWKINFVCKIKHIVFISLSGQYCLSAAEASLPGTARTAALWKRRVKKKCVYYFFCRTWLSPQILKEKYRAGEGRERERKREKMASEFKKKMFWRAVVAEFLAMSLFIFISIGSALGYNFPVIGNKTATATQDNVKVSLAFGIAIATMAQSVGHISGAHLNPAVTLGLLLSCQISVLKAFMYIVAQCLGAVVATAILSGVTSSLPNNSLGLNALAEGINSGQGLGIEIIATFQLVLCVLATTDRRRNDISGSAPLAIGLSVALGHLLAIDYTGCGINPARSLGSALVGRNFTNHWIFWVGPMLGGASAALIYDFILAPRSSDLTDRMKVWTSGQIEEYDLDGDDINTRVEMKPK
ncbi:aquaporin-1 isoform X2 [Dermochelys coriacea]|uniref:aquaporin-1 isoform X2 n=1 Tax=Dermochelys coriacea TaxID=27794 RepID=UPI001CA9F19C|nr:aquaporin-1 isoform X2 [Dermochelys coriacea]